MDGGILAELSKAAEEQVEAELKVEEIEEQLKAAKKELNDIAEKRIPELMERADMESVTTASGKKVVVAETLRASIPKARRGEAYRWLDESGNGSIIKRKVQAQFAKNEEAEAQALLERLREVFPLAEIEESVHASTLKAFVKERLENGEEVDADLFGVFVQKRAKISF